QRRTRRDPRATLPGPVSAAKDIVAGAEYVSAINVRASDRRYRAAFQRLTLMLAPPGASILDFGAGPGLDARMYAEQGRRVYAYDVDARMCDYFQGYCRDLIAAGAVALTRGDYASFLASATPAVDLVTANFAPLNLIDDLLALFAKFHAATREHGLVL